MDIYIKSRGFSKDYSWFKVSEQAEATEKPPIPDKSTHLIDEDNRSLSIVLGRFNDKLILYVVGLQASGRKDELGRSIYNSGIWIGYDSNDESVIQALIVKALQDELSDILNNVVKSSSDGSVEISSHELLDEFQKLNTSAIHGELSPTKTKKFGKLSQERKQQLAKEIAQLKHFPKKKNNLVVVTTISDKNNLEDAGVWRGLSEKITSDNEQWEDLPIPEQPSINNFLELLKNNIQEFISQKTTLLLTGFLVFLLFVNIGFVFYETRLSATINEKIEEKKLEYNQLEKDIQTLKSEKQRLETEVKDLRNLLNGSKRTIKTEIYKLDKALEK